MFQWAWKSLTTQPGSLTASALGIAFAFILVIFFDAVWQGESEQVVAYPENIKPDIWVMQSGVGNMHMAMSFVWDWKADKIASMPGVKQVTPILYLNNVIVAGNTKMFAFIVGLLPGAQRAGPWSMSAGRQIENPGEVIIPDVLSELTGIGMGDQLRITDKNFTVVGLSSGTYSSANTVLFVPFKDLEDILSSSGTYSYLLVDADDGVDAKDLAVQIRNEVDKVNALTHAEFIKNDFALASQMGVEIIIMMTTICSVLAALIVAFTAYSLVMRKRQEIAIIKALGVKNPLIFYAVTLQTGLVTLYGFVIAVVFALFAIPYIPLLVPQLTLIVSMESLLQLGAIAFVVAISGALLPTHMVLRLDPATAFHV